MNPNLLSTLEAQTKNHPDEERSKLKIHVLRNLIQKLEQDENEEIAADLEKLIQNIPKPGANWGARNEFRKSLKSIQKKVRMIFGYVQKGTLKNEASGKWMGAGLAIGVALGSGMENQGAGIPIGIAIGAGIGSSKGAAAEKKAEQDGLVY